jgi:hypothetical protein
VTPATLANRVSSRPAFAVGVAIYVVLWAAASFLACRTFGVSNAISLPLILAVPFAVALKLLLRERPPRAIEILYFVLLCPVVAGMCLAVWPWQPADSDSRDVWFEELVSAARADPAFCDVEFSIKETKDGRYQIRGTVASPADLERLQLLGSQHGFCVYRGDVAVRDKLRP